MTERVPVGAGRGGDDQVVRVDHLDRGDAAGGRRQGGGLLAALEEHARPAPAVLFADWSSTRVSA